ncbi:MAG: class I adenylate-forming enzyme family protein, partial [Pseudomonadota bacterium]
MVNLADIIDREAPADRDAIRFIKASGKTSALTYGALIEARNRLAGGLGQTNASAIGILAENCTEHVLIYLATLSAGATSVPLNHKLPAETIAHCLKDAGVGLTLCSHAQEALLPDGHKRIVIGSPAYDALFARNAAPDAAGQSDDDVAVIMYTSGSTGMPKGVPITHHGYDWAMRQFAFLRPTISGNAVLIAAPLFHMNAQFHIKSVLMCGGTAVLMERFDAAAFLDAVSQHKAARLTGVPTMFELAVRALDAGHSADTSSVVSIGMGSAPVSQALVDRLKAAFPNAAVSNGYGTTEAGPAIFGPHPDGLPAPDLSIGYPMPGVQLRLVGPHAPERGTLQVKSPMTLTGYLNLPEVTAQKLHGGWYDTGDVMRVDQDGFYLFDSRADDMFVCGGENIYPSQVEALLTGHPDIEQACVVALPDPVKGAIPIAFVVGAKGLDTDAVKTFALDNGPAYA